MYCSRYDFNQYKYIDATGKYLVMAKFFFSTTLIFVVYIIILTCLLAFRGNLNSTYFIISIIFCGPLLFLCNVIVIPVTIFAYGQRECGFNGDFKAQYKGFLAIWILMLAWIFIPILIFLIWKYSMLFSEMR